jgi:hypothetical protein
MDCFVAALLAMTALKLAADVTHSRNYSAACLVGSSSTSNTFGGDIGSA